MHVQHGSLQFIISKLQFYSRFTVTSLSCLFFVLLHLVCSAIKAAVYDNDGFMTDSLVSTSATTTATDTTEGTGKHRESHPPLRCKDGNGASELLVGGLLNRIIRACRLVCSGGWWMVCPPKHSVALNNSPSYSAVVCLCHCQQFVSPILL